MHWEKKFQGSWVALPFKDCIGAVDCTHVRVKVSNEDVPRFRGRKDYPSQNVLAACSFDLKFTYVLPRWERSTSDSRIINSTLTREDKLRVPLGKYYLVDAGFMLRASFLAPYRGVRYHLKEKSTHALENAEEIFNHRHASLQTTVEKALAMLKKVISHHCKWGWGSLPVWNSNRYCVSLLHSPQFSNGSRSRW